MRARAKVRVTMIVSPSDTWGEGTKLGQIRQQAIDSARSLIYRAQTDGLKVTDVAVETIELFDQD
jgi:hypothetical protein